MLLTTTLWGKLEHATGISLFIMCINSTWFRKYVTILRIAECYFSIHISEYPNVIPSSSDDRMNTLPCVLKDLYQLCIVSFWNLILDYLECISHKNYQIKVQNEVTFLLIICHFALSLLFNIYLWNHLCYINFW